MKEDILSRARRIADPQAAACFSDSLRRKLVLLLAHRHLSLTELADITGLELKKLHYHVTALRKLGLIAVTHERKRAGRAVKIYRAMATAFFVPERVMPSRSASALTSALRSSLDKLRDQSHDGVVYYFGEDGAPRMRTVKSPTSRHAPAGEYWKVIKLTRIKALRLEQDITDCLKRYAGGDGENQDTYLVHFAFAPGQSIPVR